MIALAWLLSCGAPEEPVDRGPEVCDAGDEAWVQRVIPLLWGRKAQGSTEVRLWAEVAREHGRDVAARAMTRSDDYVDRWQDWITDALMVARTGDRDHSACFSEPVLPDDRGELATWLATTPADGAEWPEPFNMADVLRSGLHADDVSGAWRVNLFARLARPVQGANVGPYELEESRRQAFGETFQHSYLNRDVVCLSCHNSEFSVTDAADPAEDHHWPIPGLFEQALYGSSFGIDEPTAFAVFRYADLLGGDAAVEAPWGIDERCGRFAGPGSLTEDLLGHEGYFIEAFGEAGSTWDVERALDLGVTALAEDGLQVAGDGTVDGPEAFAWLVGQSVADQVWEEATGERLTISNYFSRNEDQRDRLQELTSTFVEARWSLRALLVAVVTDPYFNAGAPESCAADPYGMAPVVNPWSVSDDDALRRGNGPGDLAHRHTARTLIRSVHASLGWSQPETFPASSDPVFVLEAALGAFLRESQPGFNGTDFQGALAFESTYGACQPPDVGGAKNGCEVTLGYGGCASCDCQGCACALDPYCCDVQWDEACVELCNVDCGGCGGGLAEERADTVDRLLEEAAARGLLVRDVVEALKDHLIADGALEAEEEALVASLLGGPLDRPVGEAADLAANLRVYCGVLLLSPDYFLALDPGPAGVAPAIVLDAAVICASARALLALEGVELSCSS